METEDRGKGISDPAIGKMQGKTSNYLARQLRIDRLRLRDTPKYTTILAHNRASPLADVTGALVDFAATHPGEPATGCEVVDSNKWSNAAQ